MIQAPVMSRTNKNSGVLMLTSFIKNFCDITFTVENMNHSCMLTYEAFYSGHRFYPLVRFFLFKRAVLGFFTSCGLSLFFLRWGFILWWLCLWLPIPQFLR